MTNNMFEKCGKKRYTVSIHSDKVIKMRAERKNDGFKGFKR